MHHIKTQDKVEDQVSHAQPASSDPSIHTRTSLHMAFFKTTWRDVWLPFLGNRLILILVGLLATYYILPLRIDHPVLPSQAEAMAFPQSLWLMWQRFDSGFYLGIARDGYWPASTLHEPSNWAFYPLYPLLIRGVALLLGGSPTAFTLAGLLIANSAILVASGYLYALVRHEFTPKVAARTILYLGLYPLAFYLSAIYTESLFLMLAVMSLYYARRQTWWLACCCGGLAAMSRSQGLMLALPLAWEYLRVTVERYTPLPTIEDLPQNHFARLRVRTTIWLRGLLLAARDIRNWLGGCWLLLIPAGLLLFMSYAYLQTGDFLATFHTNEWGWGRELTPPWRLLIYSLRNPILGDPMRWNFWALNITLVLLFLGAIVWAFYRLPSIYAVYTLVMVVLPLSSNQLDAIGRYFTLVFPVFLLLALWTEQRERVHTWLIVLLSGLQMVFMVFFVLGIPVIA